tara:strand:- start:1402 stop:2493 length:1092 start_codon:yes stop_codon:yes gene_type:complete
MTKVGAINKKFSISFPSAYSHLGAAAFFRSELEDFRVEEKLGFSLSGQGEHLYLQIEKRGDNTRWIAQLLAKHFCVDESAVGYCGLKDRRAVAIQWFSVHLPDNEKLIAPGVVRIEDTRFQLIKSSWHDRKLRRGQHKENYFTVRLREVSGDKDLLDFRLKQIASQGVPNYFGEQRFGFNGKNLMEADSLLRREYGAERKRGQKKRNSPRGGIYLSAARSYLFNLVLAERVRRNCWQSASKALCSAGKLPDFSDTGPMWGRGRCMESEEVCRFENKVLLEWTEWMNALEFSGLQQERRQLVLNPRELSWKWFSHDKISEDMFDLEVSFSLPPGSYATSLLHEFLDVKKSYLEEIPVLATSDSI